MSQRIRARFDSCRSLIAIYLGLGTCLPGPAALAQVTEIVSISTTGQQGNDISGRFAGPDLSDNGRIVVFDSQATTLVPGDTNLKVDVFARDRLTGVTERVSVSSSGVQGNDTSTRPVTNGTGELMVFDSSANNLVPGDTNFLLDVFLHNRTTHTTERISVSSNEEQGNSGSNTPSISADGRFVCFVSLASNLVPNDTNNVEDIFVRDLLNGTTERVNLGDMGQEGNSSTTLASISANGRWVVFNSFANNLVPDDTNDQFDTFIHDRQTGLTERVNVSSDEEQANGLSSNPSVNDDGRLVVFWSDATNLVPNDTNDRRDIFVRDRVAGTTERVSVSSDEEQADGSSPEAGVRGFIASNPQITPDGRYVAFFSSAKNLVPGDTNSCPPNFQEPGRCPDVFIRDRVAGTTTRVNVSASGAQANDRSSDPAITPSGQAVAFFSAAGNLVTGDNNPCPPIFPVNCADIFYHEAAATTAVPAAAQSPGVPLTVTAQPNPATAGADLAIAGTDPAAMSIVIYDVAGRVVRTLASGVPGTSTVSWNGADDRGRRVKAGVYIGRIEQGDRVAVEKIILLPD